MRIEQEDPSEKEAAFKASNKKGTSKPNPKSEYSNDDESNSKEEAKMIEESLRKQLEEKEEIQVELEKEIMVLRRKLLIAKDQFMTK